MNFNDRVKSNVQNLYDLKNWLNYSETTGEPAVRQSHKQEQHWAQLLSDIINYKKLIVRFVHPESESSWVEIFNTEEDLLNRFTEVNFDGLMHYEILNEEE